MKSLFVAWVIVSLLLSACTLAVEQIPQTPTSTSTLTVSTSTNLAPILTPIAATPTLLPSTPGAACPDSDALNLANVIVSGYTFATTEQVIEWFCNGAAFEDIVIALETEDQTNVPAEDLLTMLAAGMTWEQIWQSIGLTE